MAHSIDSAKIAKILIDAANTYIVPRYKNLQAADIQTKSHAQDFVTIADTETEEALCKILPAAIPGCIVIGEEGVSQGIVTTDVLKDPSKIIFVVDPVDGTRNFKEGKREFALMVAMVVGGETVAGWIYDILGNDMYIAEKGAGATLNGNPIRVAAAKTALDQAAGFLDAYNYPKIVQDHLMQTGAAKFPSLHCSAHEYLNVASGKADFNMVNHMKPWDHLAGVLLVQEAGGIVTKFDGSAYKPTDEKGGIIAASSMEMLAEIQSRFIQPALVKLGRPVP